MTPPLQLRTGTVSIALLEQLLEKIANSLLINPKHSDVILPSPNVQH
jgi:hypothetical protein